MCVCVCVCVCACVCVCVCVCAWQFTDEHGEVCPVGWRPGHKTMVDDPKESQKYFSTGATLPSANNKRSDPPAVVAAGAGGGGAGAGTSSKRQRVAN